MRIASVTIENYKCVRHGHLDISGTAAPGGASVTALLGESGTGKTAFAESLEVLKGLFGELGIPNCAIGSISAEAPSCKMSYEFEGSASAGEHGRLVYEVEFERKRVLDEDAAYVFGLYGSSVARVFAPDFEIRVLNETLAVANPAHGARRVLFTTAGTPLVEPAGVLESVGAGGGDKWGRFHNCANAEERVRFFKGRTYESSRSMLFEGICAGWEDYAPVQESPEAAELRAAVLELADFAGYGLYVAGTWEIGSIESGRMPLYYDRRSLPPLGRAVGENYEFEAYVSANASDQFAYYVSNDPASPTYVPNEFLGAIGETVNRVGDWIAGLVPGLELSLKVGFEPDELIDGDWITKGRGALRWQWALFRGIETDAGCRPAALMASRGGGLLPLSCEPIGIQRLASIAWLIIAARGDSGFTAVVDELDFGLHEDLLEAILRDVADNGRGQLVFVANSSKPIEALGEGCVARTTSDPLDRYVSPIGVASS